MDRNNLFSNPGSTTLTSLSARRAWIEIRVMDVSKSSIEVALRKESVDRNSGSAWVQEFPERRSPQGERG